MAVETITTVLAAATAAPPANPYDLTDLATVKDELDLKTGDTTDDAFLQRAITQVSAAIAQYCNRVFAVETVQDLLYIERDAYPYQVPGGVFALQVSRWPIVNPVSVAIAGNTHSNTTVDGIASTAALAVGMPFVGGSIPAGATIATIPGANSLTLDAAHPATASATGVALTAGLSAVQTTTVGQAQALILGIDFAVDARKGWLIRLDNFTGSPVRWEANPTTVQYQGGYAGIPADLVDATLRLVTARFQARGRDPMLRSRDQPGLGPETYWIGSIPGLKGIFPAEIAGILENYRVPVTA